MLTRNRMMRAALATMAIAVAAPIATASADTTPAPIVPQATAWNDVNTAASGAFQEGANAAIAGWQAGANAAIAGWQAGANALNDTMKSGADAASAGWLAAGHSVSDPAPVGAIPLVTVGPGVR
jgi:hypothetical protein